MKCPNDSPANVDQPAGRGSADAVNRRLWIVRPLRTYGNHAGVRRRRPVSPARRGRRGETAEVGVGGVVRSTLDVHTGRRRSRLESLGFEVDLLTMSVSPEERQRRGRPSGRAQLRPSTRVDVCRQQAAAGRHRSLAVRSYRLARRRRNLTARGWPRDRASQIRPLTTSSAARTTRLPRNVRALQQKRFPCRHSRACPRQGLACHDRLPSTPHAHVAHGRRYR
jgi:hypothetical protein